MGAHAYTNLSCLRHASKILRGLGEHHDQGQPLVDSPVLIVMLDGLRHAEGLVAFGLHPDSLGRGAERAVAGGPFDGHLWRRGVLGSEVSVDNALQ